VHEIEAIRTHLNKGGVLGPAKFQDEIEAILQRRTKITPLCLASPATGLSSQAALFQPRHNMMTQYRSSDKKAT